MESKVHPEVVTNIRTAPWPAGRRGPVSGLSLRYAGARRGCAAAALPRELRGRPHAAPADARSEERIMPCGDSEFLMWRREWHTSGSPTLVLDTQVNS